MKTPANFAGVFCSNRDAVSGELGVVPEVYQVFLVQVHLLAGHDVLDNARAVLLWSTGYQGNTLLGDGLTLWALAQAGLPGTKIGQDLSLHETNRPAAKLSLLLGLFIGFEFGGSLPD